MAHGILGHNECALVYDVEVGGSLFHLEVTELDRTNGIPSEAGCHSLGKVAHVRILFTLAGRNSGLGDVVRLFNADVGYLEDFTLSIDTSAAIQSP